MLLVFQKPLWASVMSVECREFKKPKKTVINHSFHGLTITTAQCYRAVVIWIFWILSGLAIGMK